MFLASLVMLLSAGFLLFYLQATCQGIVRREFEHGYFEAVVRANRLEFLTARNRVESPDGAWKYGDLRKGLDSDFKSLKFLLKYANNANLHYRPEERLLMAYFRLMSLSLKLRHNLKLHEKPAVLNLTSILQYFANVVGQRMSELRFAGLPVMDYSRTSA